MLYTLNILQFYTSLKQKNIFVVKMKSNSICIFQGPMGGGELLHHSVNATIVFVFFSNLPHGLTAALASLVAQMRKNLPVMQETQV